MTNPHIARHRRIRFVRAALSVLFGLSILSVPACLAAAAPATGARLAGVADGHDWALPAHVKMEPSSGWLAWGWGKEFHERAKLPRYQDGHLHFGVYLMVPWAKINPAEGVYDWSFFDARLAKPLAQPGVGFIVWIESYRRTHFKNPDRRLIPEWLETKGAVTYLADDSVAAWKPGLKYEHYFGLLLKEVAGRYGSHPNLLAVDMRGLDNHHGEWCFRGDKDIVQEAVQKTGLTPETFRAWGHQFIDDFLIAFKGREHLLVWQNGGDAVFGDKAYNEAFRSLWQKAYAAGCGGRDGQVEHYHRYLDEGHGMRYDKGTGYLEANEAFAPFLDRRMWYTENEEYGNTVPEENPPEKLKGKQWQWFASCMRALQMRRNWMAVRPAWLDYCDRWDPAFTRYLELSLGKTAENSPDAWSWLREGYQDKWRQYRAVKNFERWLIQRDVAPDGVTVPAAKIDISQVGMVRRNPDWNRPYEFEARRTDVAAGARHVYFRTARNFLQGGPHRLLLKITYLDDSAAEWCVEYDNGTARARTPSAQGKADGRWRTATFEIPDMHFRGAYTEQMDFRITNEGDSDLTVKLVRLVRPDPRRS
ncbi:MAG: hypothetical protein JXR37_28080 [Kiritimatiellae bacterium]|nr:hypothetical protein [Kiritimatiellia bacterium]